MEEDGDAEGYGRGAARARRWLQHSPNSRPLLDRTSRGETPSYVTGEKGKNRVRVFTDPRTGKAYLEYRATRDGRRARHVGTATSRAQRRKRMNWPPRVINGPIRHRCSRLWRPGADSKPEYQRTTQRTTWRWRIRKMITPRAPKCPRGGEIAKWAWVELNYRPHAYQPPQPGEDQRPPA